ncbi:NAD(P)H-hydrate dehydratase [Ruegeria arenilitoris]|uniref:NAD(P)H-hydrate dehydratase n=1 Tax=Ruegeria arenilitoris TaxID=1173585 RepID=UPI001480EA16|nr:NAD(P)H-hydrate dehydratase [Ruegeria arenilitoris]
MPKLLSSSQMRAAERAAIESGLVTGLELMERAGRGVVEAVFETWPDLAAGSGRAVVFCGPGNNGGDGFVVARILKEWGWTVDLFLLGDPEKLPADARANYERWCAMDSCHGLSDDALDAYAAARSDTVLAVDALFGTGLTRPVAGLPRTMRKLGQWKASQSEGGCPRVVCVDIPSGLCADSGRRLVSGGFAPEDCAVSANLTVTFHTAKPGHYLAEGPECCGRMSVVDIGLPALSVEETPDQRPSVLLGPENLPDLRKSAFDHKYGHGHALILTGDTGRTGAARLAARGALRVGAGLVTLGVPPVALQEVASQVTAVMIEQIAGADGLAIALRDQRLNALCLGPGLGLDKARSLVPVALESGRVTVLDADALSAFSEDPASLMKILHENCVLTPHGGEFARLFPDISAKLSLHPKDGPAFSKVDAVREAAGRAGCVVLLKGPDTVIAGPDGRCSIHSAHYDRAAPWLATAGAGDVLAGFVTGLLARGLHPLKAAETAVWLHVGCARAFGPGLIAEDLPEQLPGVLKRLQV